MKRAESEHHPEPAFPPPRNADVVSGQDSEPPLRVDDVRAKDGRLVAVRLSGDLDLFGSEAAERALARASAELTSRCTSGSASPTGPTSEPTSEPIAEPIAELVIDLTDVRFVDVAGLNLLAHTAATLAATRITIRLRNPSAMLVRMLHIAELEDRFAIDGDPDQPAG